MMIQRLYNEKHKGFKPPRCLQNVSLQNYTRGPTYRKINTVRTEKVRSVAGHALDQGVLDHNQLLHNPTAQSRMRWPQATWGSQVYVVCSILVHTLDRRCAQLWVCALDHTDRDSLLNFHLLQHFVGKDLQHKKTLKLAKTLENNKAKGITNINKGVQVNTILHSSEHSRNTLAA